MILKHTKVRRGKAGISLISIRRGARFSLNVIGTQMPLWCAPLSPAPRSGASATPQNPKVLSL
jgi:hypothetical protein